jgi:hypothetical protein
MNRSLGLLTSLGAIAAFNGSCSLSSFSDGDADPLAGVPNGECEVAFETPANDEQWWFISNEPASDDHLLLFIVGQGKQVASVTIHTDFGATGLVCGMVGSDAQFSPNLDSEVQFTLDRREFTLEAASESLGTTCVLEMRGTIADCGAPSGDGAGDFTLDVEADISLTIDGHERAFEPVYMLRRPVAQSSGLKNAKGVIEVLSGGE